MTAPDDLTPEAVEALARDILHSQPYSPNSYKAGEVMLALLTRASAAEAALSAARREAEEARAREAELEWSIRRNLAGAAARQDDDTHLFYNFYRGAASAYQDVLDDMEIQRQGRALRADSPRGESPDADA